MEKETGTPKPADNPPGNENPPVVKPEPAPTAGDPPKAAATVLAGKTEAEIAAEKRAEAAEARAKNAELTAAEKEDKLNQLIELQKSGKPAADPGAKKKKLTFRPTLLHRSEDED